MDPREAFQVLVFGVTSGALFGLAAVGLALVFGVMKMLNVAHGSLIMIGTYAAFWAFSKANIDPGLSLPLVAALLFLIGAALYWLVFSHTAKLPEGDRIKNSLLIGFGLMLILDNLATFLWTGNERSISTFYSSSSFAVSGVRIPYLGLGGAVLAVIVILALNLFLNKTYFGKSIRATSQDWEAAALSGVNIKRTYFVSFALGAALAGVAASVASATYAISPSIGGEWTNNSLIIIVLAGLGQIGPVFIAGILLGVAESISVMFIGSSYREVVGLGVFLLILVLKPEGLFSIKVSIRRNVKKVAGN
jgi:branched-chain amino acid transport system permease protein